MRILIDTHILIWYLNGDERLSAHLIPIIESQTNEIVISIASLWELAIKINSEKFEVEITLEEIQLYIASRDVEILQINYEHLLTFSTLPRHHGDPFDRMLICQALTDNISIISVDRHFPLYNVNLIK